LANAAQREKSRAEEKTEELDHHFRRFLD